MKLIASTTKFLTEKSLRSVTYIDFEGGNFYGNVSISESSCIFDKEFLFFKYSVLLRWMSEKKT